MDDWIATTEEALRTAGHRAGGARAALIDELARRDCCRSAQELHAALRARGRSVGVATVYRVLDTLVELGLVQRVEIGDGISRFEAAVPSAHHHHVVCDDCGKVEAFTDVSLERAISVLPAQLGYDIVAHEVLLRGECGDCRAA
ncbi:MAG: transcriptional repressor [Gaiellaceae bacterium MAG52_C11]|nr:transcriptional repressor [Candidatus Gaiellasilicea maunaloa]